MSDHRHSDQPTNATGGNFVALVLVVSVLIVGALILFTQNSGEPQQERPVVTIVGRNLNWRPSPTPSLTPTNTATLRPTRTPTFTPSALPTATPTPLASPTPDGSLRIAGGERVFQSVCSACHGFSAQGISGLGPSMIANDFINSQGNADLHAFILAGRSASDPANKSGIPMPARGGNPALSDDDIMNVVHYIRSLNPDVVVADAGAAPADSVAPEPQDTAPREPVVALEFEPLSLSGVTSPDPDPVFDPDQPDPFFALGEERYNRSCAGCHGLDGEGVPMLARPLTESEAIAARDGIAIFELLVNPSAEQGYVHPYRGGYPELTDEDILAIIGYIFTLTDSGQ